MGCSVAGLTAVNVNNGSWVSVVTIATGLKVVNRGALVLFLPRKRSYIYKEFLHRNSLKYMWGYKIVPITNLSQYHSKYSCE